jgi:TrwC relaxase
VRRNHPVRAGPAAIADTGCGRPARVCARGTLAVLRGGAVRRETEGVSCLVETDLGTTTSPRTAKPSTAPPRALGGVASWLGITREVTEDHRLRLLDGRHSITGERLFEYRKDRVAGVDRSASARKSVWVVWAVGAPEERRAVEQAQDRAVSAMVEHMRRRCQLVRDHGEPELANDVLAVAVNHYTSRQTKEQPVHGTASDPQLHTHVLWLLTVAEDRAEPAVLTLR